MKRTDNERIDGAEYYQFTGPARLDKAMHTLEGMLDGIAADSKVNDAELASLTHWISDNAEFANKHPFNEIIKRLNTIVDRQVVDEEEVADIVWLCNKLTTKENYYDAVSSDMQRLQGLLSGIIADGKITEDELKTLGKWLRTREHLKTIWPYDEIESIVTVVMLDGKIDAEEQEMLVSFFSQFARTTEHKTIDIESTTAIEGVCALCPEIEFGEKRFCFTGTSGNATRKELVEHVVSRGGQHSGSLTGKVDYLVVCPDGNRAWAYACYGRKVEKAVRLRKDGSTLQIIHENDFWDAVQDD